MAGVDHCTRTTKYTEHRGAISYIFGITLHRTQRVRGSRKPESAIDSKGSQASQKLKGVKDLQRAQRLHWGSEAQRPLGPGSQAGFRGTLEKEQ